MQKRQYCGMPKHVTDTKLFSNYQNIATKNDIRARKPTLGNKTRHQTAKTDSSGGSKLY